jgi:hypothetical protein
MTVTAFGGLSGVPVPDWGIFGTGASVVDTLCDAAKEACIYVGQIWWADGGSHTIDTTGSSSIGWMTGTVTWANAGSTGVVGLATVDTANGPPARATNSTDTITFSVSKSYTGGAGISSTTWTESVPNAGTMTIASGDLVAWGFQVTARAGVDAVRVRKYAANVANYPSVTDFTGAAYAANGGAPNVVLTASDGTLGYFVGGAPMSAVLATAFNNGSASKEIGNLFQFPVPVTIIGADVLLTMAASADVSLIAYTAPLIAPVSAGVIAIDANTVNASASGRRMRGFFPTAISLPVANTPLVLAIQPTTANSVTLNGRTFNSSTHQGSHELGTNCYAVNRGTVGIGTPFAAQNSNKDIIHISLLLSGFDGGGGVVKMAGNGGGFVG